MKKTTQAVKRNITGSRIKQARLRCKPSVSQDDLSGRLAARGIFVDQAAISRIEKGKRYVMDYEVAAIAKCLRVPTASLFGEAR